MPKPAKTPAKSKSGKPLAAELLQLYDDLTAVNASTAFVLHALSSTLEAHALPSSRATVGGVFCVQWLNDRMQILEKQLRDIRKRTAAGRRCRLQLDNTEFYGTPHRIGQRVEVQFRLE